MTIIEPPSLGSFHPLRAAGRLLRHGDLFRTLSAHRIRVRYKQSRLGLAWALVQPVAMMLVFTLVFSVLGRAPGQGTPYALFAYSALLPWTFVSSGLSSAATGIVGHASLITKVYFPREILPLTYVVAAFVDFAVASIALAALMAWYGVPLTIHALWTVPIVILLAAIVAAAGIALSAVHVRHRDVGLAVPVLLQIWMFLSPILYPLSAVQSYLSPAAYAWYVLNPMAGLIDGFRRAVVLHRQPDLQALAAATAAAAVALPAAYLYFKRAEATMADVV